MVWLKENKLSVLINYINIIFMLRVISACYSIQDFNYILATVLYLLGLAVYWVYHSVLEKKKYNALMILGTLAVIIVFLLARREMLVAFFQESIVVNFNNINDALYAGSYTYFVMFKPFIVVLMPAITIFLTFMSSKGWNNSVLILTLGVMTYFWYLGYIEEVRYRLVTFIILSVATYAINSHIKNLKQLAKQGIHVVLERNKLISYILVYSFIIGWIGVFLPQQYEGKYTETGEKRWTNPFGPEVGDSPIRAKEGTYGLDSSGYNNTESKLGGAIELDDELAFKVDADKSYYLRGDVKEVYTGSAWKKELEEYVKESSLADSEINNYILNLPGINADIAKKTITIYPEKVNSSTLFVPGFPLEVRLEKGNVYHEKNGLTFANSGRVTKEYNVDFYDPDMVMDAIDRNPRNRRNGFSRAAYEKYLQVPETVTVRTVELVYSLVNGAKNDREKIENIKNYLSVNYPYSLEVSAVPEGVDFVDYFLFTEKKGYCVYFATAMTVMARIANIPARYVEGFKMPDEKFGGFYEVTSEQAHAWAEVFVQQSPQIWRVVDCSTTPAEERERKEKEEAGGGEENEPTPSATPQPKPEDNPAAGGDTKEEGTFILNLSNREIAVIGVVTLLTLLVLVRVAVFERRKRKMLKTPGIIPLYSYFLKRVKFIGINKSELVTDMEFATDIFDYELKSRAMELVKRVYDEFYGGAIDKDFDKLDFYRFIETYIKQRQNTIKYYYLKYFR